MTKSLGEVFGLGYPSKRLKNLGVHHRALFYPFNSQTRPVVGPWVIQPSHDHLSLRYAACI